MSGVVVTVVMVSFAIHYAHVLIHEVAHAALLWLFFRDRGRVTIRMTLQGSGSTSLTNWSGAPPTRRDLHRYAAAQLAGPLVTVATLVVLLAIGVALLDDPAAVPTWQTAAGVAALSVALANAFALGICCCAPGHDIWLMRAALRASRGGRLPPTLQEAVIAHAPPRRP